MIWKHYILRSRKTRRIEHRIKKKNLKPSKKRLMIMKIMKTSEDRRYSITKLPSQVQNTSSGYLKHWGINRKYVELTAEHSETPR